MIQVRKRRRRAGAILKPPSGDPGHILAQVPACPHVSPALIIPANATRPSPASLKPVPRLDVVVEGQHKVTAGHRGGMCRGQRWLPEDRRRLSAGTINTGRGGRAHGSSRGGTRPGDQVCSPCGPVAITILAEGKRGGGHPQG